MENIINNDNPTSPYSAHEQQVIMRDFEQSKKQALEEGDTLKSYYLNEIEND